MTAKARVLIVEDHVPSAEMMKRTLETAGYDAKVAVTAGDAFAEVHTFHPEVVILDLALPWLSGEEIATTLRAQGNKALLIAVSGMRGDTRALAKIGFDYFLRKPVPMEIVLDLLEMHAIGKPAPPAS